MKIAVDLTFSDLPINFRSIHECCPVFIDWNYPFLPRVGEYISCPARFFSERQKKLFKETKCKDFFDDGMGDYWSEKSVYDFYMDANGNRWIVDGIDWTYWDDIGDFPVINISQEVCTPEHLTLLIYDYLCPLNDKIDEIHKIIKNRENKKPWWK